MYESYLGYTQAINELQIDPDLKLFEVEIGQIYLLEDPTTPIETHEVVVAAYGDEEAADKAENFCAATIPVISGIMFSASYLPAEIEI